MIRTRVIDDEAERRQAIISMLQGHCPNILIAGEADTVDSGIEAILAHQPDLILMDICLGKQLAFEILDVFEPVDFKLIFITSDKEYALRAIKYSALDYLLKPVALADLRKAIQKAEMQLMKELHLQLHELRLNMDSRERSRIVLRTAEKMHIIQIHNIVRCEASRNYSSFFLCDKRSIMVSQPMKEYEDMLLSHGFYRLHKSHIVNMEYVETYERSDGGHVVLTDGTRLPVADRKKADLLKYFNRF